MQKPIENQDFNDFQTCDYLLTTTYNYPKVLKKRTYGQLSIRYLSITKKKVSLWQI
jgi:hypothetical protein